MLVQCHYYHYNLQRVTPDSQLCEATEHLSSDNKKLMQSSRNAGHLDYSIIKCKLCMLYQMPENHKSSGETCKKFETIKVSCYTHYPLVLGKISNRSMINKPGT